MSDYEIEIELSQREKEILALELSKASQNATGGFFSSRDEIQNNLESHFSDEISSERIDEICNAIIDDIYSFGGDVKYDEVKGYLENYGVLLDEANPVDLGFTQSNDQSQGEDTNSAKHDSGAEDSRLEKNSGHSEKAKPSTGSKHEDDKSEKYDAEQEEKERQKEVEERAQESLAKAAELKQKASDIRRSMSEKAFMNPYALMGYTFAMFAIKSRVVMRNIVDFALPHLARAIPGRQYLGDAINHKAKEERFNWRNEKTPYENGMDLLNKLRRTNEDLKNDDFEGAQSKLNSSLEDLSKKKIKFDKKDKPKVQEVMRSISEALKGKGKDDEAVKQMKKNMEKMNALIINMLKKLFGIKTDKEHSSPEVGGP